jgi:ribosomal protein S18 acetylase RimI-like enzyme
MPDLRLQSISQTDWRSLSSLMAMEELGWSAELDWDYSPIRRILDSFILRRILPGYVAMRGQRAVGYTYFLIQKDRATVGAVYAAEDGVQEIADSLLSQALASLQQTRSVRRIEAQLLPLNGIEVEGIFAQHGFQHYLRDYLELRLEPGGPMAGSPAPVRIVPWDPAYLPGSAEVAYSSYRTEIDSLISRDYASAEGCASYLRSLVEHPGCGIFLPDASYVALDPLDHPCGFILTSRLSSTSAMIPQISIAPSHQGLGLGRHLIGQAIARIEEQKFRTVRLTVTRDNRRAYEWYRRLGFNPRTTFGAYVWTR